jgi:hypothetical protein
MVRVYKFFLYALIFVVMVLAFFPKTNLYYLLEKEAAVYKVLVSDETVSEGIFGLDIKDASISYEALEVAKVAHVSTLFLLFYDEITAENIVLSPLAESYIPRRVDLLQVSYSLLHPLSLEIYAKGDFGEARGSFDLKEQKVFLTIEPSKLLKQNYKRKLWYLKKSKTGEYTYEKSL